MRPARALVFAGVSVAGLVALAVGIASRAPEQEEIDAGSTDNARGARSRALPPERDAADQRLLVILREIRDTNTRQTALLESIAAALEARPSADASERRAGGPTPGTPAEEWSSALVVADRNYTAARVVDLRSRLMVQASRLRTSVSERKGEDPQVVIDQRRLRRTEEALERIVDVRDAAGLAAFADEFGPVLPP